MRFARPIAIIMYHYVRSVRSSTFPEIKGLELECFEGQLDYLARHFRFVSMADLVRYSAGEASLPDRAALLTFDDGYKDHFRHVYPSLRRRGISGIFYPPAKAIFEKTVLDVNKIHFILASGVEANALAAEIDLRLIADGVLDPVEFRGKYFVGGRFDGPAVNYVKRLLLLGLPHGYREEFVGKLFREFVTEDEPGFSSELYLSLQELREMAEGGMEVGSHGYDHLWLSSRGGAEQRADIEKSLELLDLLPSGARNFHFCYPFGSYNEETLNILRGMGCVSAVTTKRDLARVSIGDGMLELARLDTNDMPVRSDAARNDWTNEVFTFRDRTKR